MWQRGFSSIVLALATTSARVLSAPTSSSTFANRNAHFDVGDGTKFGVPGNATFDYVVVGGGTAGLAVAYRLAESGQHSVAMIEAGGFYQLENGNQSVVPM